MVSATTIISTLVGIVTIIIGLFISPIPRNLGLYRFIASKEPSLIGLTPAFHHGIKWSYTFEELYGGDICSRSTRGQRALITGANSGVGYETARALAKCGVHVTMACRNTKKCAAAADKIKQEAKDVDVNANVETMNVDMSSLKSVQRFSKEFLARNQESDGGALDMLYLNAGISANTHSLDELVLSEDGIELVFATNYLGHHLMYTLLEPLLLKSKFARVIQTSSAASFNTFDHVVATTLDKLNNTPGYENKPTHMKYYGQSKLAQILWVKHLTKRLSEKGIDSIYANACHPGAVDTGIWDKSDVKIPQFMNNFIDYIRDNVMWTTEEGALTQLYLGMATDQLKSKDIRGKFFHPQVQEVVNPLSLDEKLQFDLWEFSNELISKFL
jgi:NAD(P)-dependent dehydrogenase (short-subunit alcohol dehydrogenase family)